ncbi:hypothetical protein TTHERM_01027570 (macronuclear) [Tetrahymena thermophila SB210]|uniref:Protein kinase domain-containing protein n=1 Tax=Tetrahymena thermophila (strain SB210) TaxID=312017 RepID=Q22CM1_TETTS|nr:hypothetical protein TTHERM_01027570 [Tetrahymena thermophila SB210]EAR83031.2 hypothetical protein TTHERM_01027570 [Tetrahymena thermophila SB210]|eukprot:XP_001030694.2 hypothetical protein TTHERM_01027570 [Tetrahymena thermophila SB210]
MEFGQEYLDFKQENQQLTDVNDTLSLSNNTVQIYSQSCLKSFHNYNNFDSLYLDRQYEDEIENENILCQNFESKLSEIHNQEVQACEKMEVGEIFYLRRKLANTQNIFKGYSEYLNQKVVGVLFSVDTQEYQQLNMANFYIKQKNVTHFFNLEMYQIPNKSVQSQYSIREIKENCNEQLSMYSIQRYFKGSLEDFILKRQKIKMEFSAIELEDIFYRLLQIGSCLESLFLYHQDFKVSKILLNFNSKTLQYDKQSIVLSSLQDIYKFNSNDKFFDNNNYDIEKINNFNGYVTPEVADFEPKIMIFKQNSFAIGLFMLNLLILDIFSPSRFIDGYQKGIYFLQKENISDNVRKGVNLLLQQDQQQRYTCQNVLKEIYKEKFYIIPFNDIDNTQLQIKHQEQSPNNFNEDNSQLFETTNIQFGKNQNDDSPLNDEFDDTKQVCVVETGFIQITEPQEVCIYCNQIICQKNSEKNQKQLS